MTTTKVSKSSHRIRIQVESHNVYEAIATKRGLEAWFTPQIQGEVTPGETAVFRHVGCEKTRWRFIAMDPGKSSCWECVEGPGAVVGTSVLFTLTGEGPTTVVQCVHDCWPEEDAAFSTCNTLWGILMGRLKDYAESGKTQPALRLSCR